MKKVSRFRLEIFNYWFCFFIFTAGIPITSIRVVERNSVADWPNNSGRACHVGDRVKGTELMRSLGQISLIPLDLPTDFFAERIPELVPSLSDPATLKVLTILG